MSNQLRLLFFIVVISGALCTVEDYVIMSQCAHNKAIHLAAEGTVSVTDISQTQNITIVGLPDYVNNAFKIALYAKETQRYLCFNDNWRLVGLKVLQDTCYFNETIVHGYFVFRSVLDLQRRVGFTHRGKAVGPKKSVNDACYMFTKIQADQFFHQHPNAPKTTTSTIVATAAATTAGNRSKSRLSSTTSATTPQRAANRSKARGNGNNTNNNKNKKLRNNKKSSNNNQIKQQHSQYGHNSNLSNSNSHVSSANRHNGNGSGSGQGGGKQLGVSQQLQQQQRNNTREHVHHQVRHHHNDPNLMARRQQHEHKQKRRQRLRQRTTTPAVPSGESTTTTSSSTRTTTVRQKRLRTVEAMLITKSLPSMKASAATRTTPLSNGSTATTMFATKSSPSGASTTSGNVTASPTMVSPLSTASTQATHTASTATVTQLRKSTTSTTKISPTSVVTTPTTPQSTEARIPTTSSTTPEKATTPTTTLTTKRKGHRRKGQGHKKPHHHKQTQQKQKLPLLPLAQFKESRGDEGALPQLASTSETFNENYTDSGEQSWSSATTILEDSAELDTGSSGLTNEWLELDGSTPTASRIDTLTTLVTDPGVNEPISTTAELRDYEQLWNDLEPSVTTIQDSDTSPTSVRDGDISATSVRDTDSSTLTTELEPSLSTNDADLESSMATAADLGASLSTSDAFFSTAKDIDASTLLAGDFELSPSAATTFGTLSTVPPSQDLDPLASSSRTSLSNTLDPDDDDDVLVTSSAYQPNSSINPRVATATLPTFSSQPDSDEAVLPTKFVDTNMLQVEPTNLKAIQATVVAPAESATAAASATIQSKSHVTEDEQTTSTTSTSTTRTTTTTEQGHAENFYERSKAKQHGGLPSTLATLLHRHLLRQRQRASAYASPASAFTATINGHRAGLSGDIMTEYILNSTRHSNDNMDNTSNSGGTSTLATSRQQSHASHRNSTTNALLLSAEQKLSEATARFEATQAPTATTTTNASNSKFIQALLEDFMRWNKHLESINKVTTNNTVSEYGYDAPTTSTLKTTTPKKSASSLGQSVSASSTPPVTTTKKTLRKSTQKLMATPFHQLTYVRNKDGDIDIDSIDNLSVYSDVIDDEDDRYSSSTDITESGSPERELNLEGSALSSEDQEAISDEVEQLHQKVKKHHHHHHKHHQAGQNHHPHQYQESSKAGNSRLTIVNGYMPATATSVLPESLRLAKIKLEAERKRLQRQRRHGA